MSVRSLQDQIDGLLSKEVVQPKVGGVPSPDIETASVVESLALAFMLQPRSALYVHYLAKTGLLAAISNEVLAIEVLKKTIDDLANTTYAIKNTSALKRAQAAMLQLSSQGQLSSSSNAFTRYSAAVDEFLNKQLSKNIKTPGSTEMVRPGEEAGQALPGDLTSLKDAHTVFLDRLYSEAVGIANFESTPFSALVGANAVYRAKRDLDSLVSEIEADESGAQSRDAAIRLIGSRATVRLVGSKTDLADPVIDTVRHLPPDIILTGQSVPTAVVASTSAGPFVMASGGSLSMAVGGSTVATSALNQAGNAAAVLGSSISFPVMVPANYHLFLRLEAVSGLSWTGPVSSSAGPTNQGTYSEVTLGDGWLLASGVYYKTLKVTLNSGYAPTVPPEAPPGGATPQSRTMANVLAAISSTLGAFGTAVEFVQAGTGRILIVASQAKIKTIAIAPSTFTMETQGAGYSVPAGDPAYGATAYYPRVYSNSFHSELGFNMNQTGSAGSTPAARIKDALDVVFSSLVTTELNADSSITMTSLATSPGIGMDFSGTWVASLGLQSSYIATSAELSLLDSNLSVVAPSGRLDVGDVFQSSTGQSQVSGMTTTTVSLSSPIRTFSGPITVTSALYLVWQEIDSKVQAFLSSWTKGPFAIGLSSVDQLIAVLIGSPTSPRRREAIALLDDLKAQLDSLQIDLTTVAATLPVGSASVEKSAINNVIALFLERKFDRALELLLRCKIQDVFQIDWQSASFSGNLMKAAESIAQSDIKFPNMTQDEGFDVSGQRKVGPSGRP
jgi:hypothetical protein